MYNIFFTTGDGLTSTSAAHYANMAQELIQAKIEKLNSVKFYETSVESINGQREMIMSKGVTDISNIENDLNEIGAMNSFCAWMREAIKEKENGIEEVKSTPFSKWANRFGHILPEEPSSPLRGDSITEKEVLNSWSIKKRNEYFTMEAMASTYGKYIHPKGAFSGARKELHTIVNEPITKEGTGRDLILYTRTATIEPTVIDSEFMRLQSLYRNYEQKLNHLKAEVKDTVNQLTLEREKEYQKKLDEFSIVYNEYRISRENLNSEWNKWKTSEMERISKLKIVVPKELEEVFKRIKEASNTSK